ncbi:MAG: protein phosphatase 2C domain-containing protein [Gammaproteobacteria bacterium]|nr:protein phosphatase 2C domain-containing protein [Gammaproteobacteria bacterium]
MLKFAVDSHCGNVRKLNEDSFAAVPDIGLWLVADGVGGHDGGEVASELTRSTIISRFQNSGDLVGAFEEAHRVVCSAIEQHKGGANMASTVVALALQGDDFQIAWVGDSRAYLWQGALRLLTRDHSVVEELVSRGEISREEGAHHPSRHIITRCIGMSSNLPIEVSSLSGTLADGESLLLCSDGLNDFVSTQNISNIMSSTPSPGSRVAQLIQAALEGGGRDNVTVAVIDSGASRVAELGRGGASTSWFGSQLQRLRNIFLRSRR